MPATPALDGLPAAAPAEPFGLRIDAPSGDDRLTGLPVPTLREAVRAHRLVLLRGFCAPDEPEELARWCRTWGEVMAWPFGDVLELREAEEPTDHIFDSSSVPLHWDGMYKPLIPEFQVFHCVRAPGGGDGGRTVFCDTVSLLEHCPPEVLELWRRVTVTYRIRSVVHYGGRASSPLIVPHPRSGVPTLRFNEPPPQDEPDFLNRPAHAFDGVGDKDVPALLAGLRDALHDPRFFLAHTWHSGDVLIADNYALLHGRERFTSRAPRHLRRVHLLGDPAFANPAVA
ncbi:TauD/TfdA family dioxygenase [Streptomyces sp. RKND-216]|uniref:TauD/TfdA dioxygenase family protein n=1 Tax=Streptomyces sp. RKND-216 TaxID=2562581 RepID=UPI00109DAC90|nr:TauD/TfdA family dioxygenase [Streptomyces sp. RKND-216]THA24422.1 TauD/TfdA family dioxygenase [Streptomyces sp. RKND-216]